MEHLNLFDTSPMDSPKNFVPLAERMRPRNFNEFFGQQHILQYNSFLRRMIETDHILSMILYGPPGTGKTTLARIIAETTKSNFRKLNAVSSGISDIRKLVEEAEQERRNYGKRTILFIDEIHRFNKAQQDVLLPYVEDGRLILIGATTENPFFEVNHALLSRVKIIKLEPLTPADIINIIKATLEDSERGYGESHGQIEDQALELIAQISKGDARVALNILEQVMESLPPNSPIDKHSIEEITTEQIQYYDKSGDNHYDITSAFIKSMRASDPDAALHYLARMLAGGEDLDFIARRVVICASEDVGNADPQALVVATAAAEAVRFLGMPEARIPLAQAVTYIAAAPKSNASYLAIDDALHDVRTKDCGSIPTYLRYAHYKGASKLGHGLSYQYPHNYPEHIASQPCLPETIRNQKYYKPTTQGYEQTISTYLDKVANIKHNPKA